MAYDTFAGLPLDQSVQGSAWDNGGVTWGTPTYLSGNGANAAKIAGVPNGFEIIGNFLPPEGTVGAAVFFRAGSGRASTANAATLTIHGNGSAASPNLLSGIRAVVGGYGKLGCRNLVDGANVESNFTLLEETDYCLEISQPNLADKRQYIVRIYSVVSGARGAVLAETPVLTIATERPATARMSQLQISGGFTNTTFSRVETIDAPAADVTAPVLSSPTASANGANAANGSVTTNEAGGTLYYLVSTAASATAAQVKAGQSKAVTATGAQSASVNGLTAATSYRFHFLHRDPAGNDSAVATSAAFTTGAAGDTTAPVLQAPTAAATGPTTAIGSVATDEAGGLLYRYTSTAASGVTAATIKAANLTQTVEATGTQECQFTGLTPSATLYAYYLQQDAAGNESAIVRSSAFTTQAAPVGGTVAADFPLSWAIEAAEESGQGGADGSKISASRKIVFPGGTRVVPFGTQPSSIIPGAPSCQSGKWWSDKHPLDERYWVADMSVDLAEAGSPAVSVEPIVAGVTVLEQPVIQGALIPIKLGGLDLTTGAANYCTFRVTCANGEQFDRTIWFRPQEGKWELLKDPEDKRFYVADVTNDLVDSNTAATAAMAIPVGVAELVAAQVQAGLIVVKLGGMDTSPDPTNYCTLRIDCANGERFYRTIHFTRVDN